MSATLKEGEILVGLQSVSTVPAFMVANAKTGGRSMERLVMIKMMLADILVGLESVMKMKANMHVYVKAEELVCGVELWKYIPAFLKESSCIK
jgi:hypothetical protein